MTMVEKFGNKDAKKIHFSKQMELCKMSIKAEKKINEIARIFFHNLAETGGVRSRGFKLSLRLPVSLSLRLLEFWFDAPIQANENRRKNHS